MIKFEFRNEKIITTPQFFLFHEFTNIWKYDKSKEKLKAHKLLYFIFLLCDISEDNPLRDVDLDKKEQEALYRVYGKKTHKFSVRERKLLEPAIACYIKYNETAEERILQTFDNKAIEVREEVEKTKPESVENVQNGVTSFASNSSIITKALKELDYVKKQKVTVIAAIRKEAMSHRVRGQVKLSPLSKGNLQLPSVAEMHRQMKGAYTNEIRSIQRESESVEGLSAN